MHAFFFYIIQVRLKERWYVGILYRYILYACWLRIHTACMAYGCVTLSILKISKLAQIPLALKSLAARNVLSGSRALHAKNGLVSALQLLVHGAIKRRCDWIVHVEMSARFSATARMNKSL